MSSPHRLFYLYSFRKRSYLTQTDIAFLLGLPDRSIVAKWEGGKHSPNLETIILYHLIFDIPHDTLFHESKENFAEKIIARIKELTEVLSNGPADKNLRQRIQYLDSILKRLSDATA